MKNPVEIYVEIIRDNDKDLAILVSDGVSQFWLPRSQIEIEYRKDGAEITLPEWLAIEKEII